MGHPETAHRHQKAVWWPVIGLDGEGEPIRGDGVELDVRWEETKTQYTDEAGSIRNLDAIAILDREVSVGDLMWEGELSEYNGTGSVDPESQLMQVKTYQESPDIKHRKFRREAGLVFFRSTPPA